MSEPFDRLRRFLRELKRRNVYKVAATYAAVSFVLWQVANIVVPALRLPEWTLTLVVVLTLMGFPVAVVLAWGWELTPEGAERREGGKAAPPGAPPGAAEPGAGVEEAEGAEERTGLLARHPRAVAVGITAALVTLVGVGLWTASREAGSVPEPDGRMGLAVFPFRSQGENVAHWSEGAPDLLTTALEGTPGVRVVDPWSLWQPLRPKPSAGALPPAPERAETLTRGAGGHRYVLGSVVESGDRAELALRLYAVGRDDALETFQVSVESDDDVAGAVRKAALRLLAAVRDTGAGSGAQQLQFPPTTSPQAVKAYLAAREAMRRGRFDSAEAAIDRSMQADSTFVPAIVTAIPIKSWVQYLDGEPYTGLIELVERGEAHAENATESMRLRLEVARAQVRTDGEECMESARELIRMDSTDLMAWSDLQACHRALGWQYGAGVADMRQAGDRIVALDSTFVPGLTRRAGLAGIVASEEEIRRWIDRLERTETDAPAVEGTIAGLRGVVAGDQRFAELATDLAERPRPVWREAVRIVRTRRPDRADRLLEARAEAAESREALEDLEIAGLRMDVARGRVGRVDSLLRAGEVELWWAPSMFLAGADLAGVGSRPPAERALERLSETVPPDSAVAMFERYPVWQTAWMVGAHNAAHGSPSVARRWREVIGEFPEGGTPKDPWGALRADLEARLAARRGDTASALERARRAYRLWDIHTANTYESHPEPFMRLHLAELYRRAGMPDSARAFYRSLTPPTTWLGFLTTRAWYELGRLASEGGGPPERAARHLRRARRYWEGGDAGAVGELRGRARELLASLPTTP